MVVPDNVVEQTSGAIAQMDQWCYVEELVLDFPLACSSGMPSTALLTVGSAR